MNKKIFLLAILLLIVLTPVGLHAENILPDCAISKQDGTPGNAVCGLCDFIEMGLRIFRWILGLVGGLSLLLFVWHGFGWLTSMGDSEKVKKTKDALVHTVIGIMIILASWLIVNLVVVILTFNIVNPTDKNANKPKDNKIGLIFGNQAWNDLSKFCPKK